MPTPTPDPAQSCEPGYMGDPTSCKDYDTWKQYASDECAAKKMGLTDLATGAQCADGRFIEVKFMCCGPAGTTPVEPPPTGETCLSTTLGDGKTCVSPDLWKTHAAEACATQKMELRALDAGLTCADGTWSLVKFECCGQS